MKGSLITFFGQEMIHFVPKDALRHVKCFHDASFAFNWVDLWGKLPVVQYHYMALMRH